MSNEKRFLVDVGIKDLPFPLKVVSRANPDGQPTVANISISARITHEFEAKWIDKFIQIVHRHQQTLGTKTLSSHILDYLKALNATAVTMDFHYPFFVEKFTPVSKEPCLVKYSCTHTGKVFSAKSKPKTLFKIEVPVITTYPRSDPVKSGGLFGQLSVMEVTVESQKEIFPEDLVEMVDKHALIPIYSFLTEHDQDFVIHKVHSVQKSSVVVADEIKEELAQRVDVDWFSVRAFNYGMLHTYSTVVGTEKSMWVPSSGLDREKR